jgi:hypothetical protein
MGSSRLLAEVWIVLPLLAAAVILGQLSVWNKSRHVDPFFAIYLGSGVIYTLIVPSLIMLNDAARVIQYLQVQIAVVGLFFVPVMISYRFSGHRNDFLSRGRLSSLQVSRRISLVLLVGTIQGALSAYVLYRHGFFFQRLGNRASAEAAVSLSSQETVIVGTFEDAQNLWVVLCVLVLVRPPSLGLYRSLARLSALSTLVLVLIPAVVNSRLDSLLLLAVGAGAYLCFTECLNVGQRLSWRWASGLLVAALGVVMVVQGLRSVILTDISDGVTTGYSIGRPIDQSQGFARIDCVDFLVRVESDWNELPGFDAFRSTVWQIRRYLDPDGYRYFRLSGETNPKSYFVRRHIDSERSDYFSCSIVEVYGAFGWPGLLFSGIILGLLFRVLGIAIIKGLCANTFVSILALAIILWLVKFEKGMSGLVIGWTNQLVVVVFLTVVRPFDSSMPASVVDRRVRRRTQRSRASTRSCGAGERTSEALLT